MKHWIIIIVFFVASCQNNSKDVKDYFDQYGYTTFYIHKAYSIDSFTWVGSYMVRDGMILSRQLTKDSTAVIYHVSVIFDYPITTRINR